MVTSTTASWLEKSALFSVVVKGRRWGSLRLLPNTDKLYLIDMWITKYYILHSSYSYHENWSLLKSASLVCDELHQAFLRSAGTDSIVAHWVQMLIHMAVIDGCVGTGCSCT